MAKRKYPHVPCRTCKGAGQIPGLTTIARACPRCKGAGRIIGAAEAMEIEREQAARLQKFLPTAAP